MNNVVDIIKKFCPFVFFLSVGLLVGPGIQAQAGPGKVKALKVGDKVPDIEFDMLNFSMPKIKLSEFKRKAIILDFWATWCASCIANFKKIDSFQYQFRDQLQFICVNSKRDSDKKLRSFVETTIQTKYTWLSVAQNDSLAIKYFPHNAMPYYVWINSKGRVEAITGSKDITEQNIRKFINGDSFDFTSIVDDHSQEKVLLLSDEDVSISELYMYSFFKRGRVDACSYEKCIEYKFLKSKNRPVRVLLTGIAMHNVTLLDILEKAYTLDNDFSRTRSLNRLLIDSSVEKNILQEIYSYERIATLPSDSRLAQDSLSKILLSDLNSIGEISVIKTTKKLPCYILRRRKGVHKTTSDHDKDDATLLNKYSLNDVVAWINSNIDSRLPIIAEASDERFHLSLTWQGRDLEKVRDELNNQGFELAGGLAPFEVLMVTKKNKK